MGGAVGLKGTDGKIILTEAISLGAKPIAWQRAETFLAELIPVKKSLRLFVGAGNMGEDEANKCGFSFDVIGETKKATTSEDTQNIAKAMVESGVDLLVFCGGDGTSRDILKAVDLSSCAWCSNRRQNAQRHIRRNPSKQPQESPLTIFGVNCP